jgi:hypothetical protein
MAKTNANLIWKIADLLRGPYQPNQYGQTPSPSRRRGEGDDWPTVAVTSVGPVGPVSANVLFVSPASLCNVAVTWGLPTWSLH